MFLTFWNKFVSLVRVRSLQQVVWFLLGLILAVLACCWDSGFMTWVIHCARLFMLYYISVVFYIRQHMLIVLFKIPKMVVAI